jgi:hypothetical protein
MEVADQLYGLKKPEMEGFGNDLFSRSATDREVVYREFSTNIVMSNSVQTINLNYSLRHRRNDRAA